MSLKEKLSNAYDHASTVGKGILITAGVATGLFVVSLPWTCKHFDRDSYSGVVTEKDRIPEKGYRVSLRLDDGSIRTFENKDSTLEWKFNSADIQGKLEYGKRCTVETYGFRIPFFSMFENIVDVQCYGTSELEKKTSEK